MRGLENGITLSKVWFFVSALIIGVSLKEPYLGMGVWFFGCGIEAAIKGV